MGAVGTLERYPGDHEAVAVEAQWGEVSRPKVGRVGVGDVLGQQPLAFLVPSIRVRSIENNGRSVMAMSPRTAAGSEGTRLSWVEFAGFMVDGPLSRDKTVLRHQSAVYHTIRIGRRSGRINAHGR